jgi:hypothetical protein
MDMDASVEQYTYHSYSKAVAKKSELEREGYRVFTPYWQPRSQQTNGLLVGGTWNIIWIPYDVMFT